MNVSNSSIWHLTFQHIPTVQRPKHTTHRYLRSYVRVLVWLYVRIREWRTYTHGQTSIFQLLIIMRRWRVKCKCICIQCLCVWVCFCMRIACTCICICFHKIKYGYGQVIIVDRDNDKALNSYEVWFRSTFHILLFSALDFVFEFIQFL